MTYLKRRENILKVVKHKLEQTFFDGIRRDFQLEHFILLIVSIFQQFTRLTSLHFFAFSIDR